MHLPCVLDGNHVLALKAGIAKLRDGRGGVRQQSGLIRWIHPGSGHNARAVARSDLVFVIFDDRVQCGRIDQALFDHQRFQRFDP
jgi:hypothetical protein